MANTTKTNVLIIAPELTSIIDNTAQVDLISVVTVTNTETYSNTINGTTVSYTSDGTATKYEIVTGLISAIQGNSTTNALVSCTNNGDGTYYLTSKTAGTAVTILVSSKLSKTNIVANFNGDSLFNLILTDVIEEIDTLSINTETQEKAQRYLTAHILSLQQSGSHGNVRSESVGRASITYAGGDMFDPDMLSRTRYGAEFLRIWKKNRSLKGI